MFHFCIMITLCKKNTLNCNQNRTMHSQEFMEINVQSNTLTWEVILDHPQSQLVFHKESGTDQHHFTKEMI